MTLNVLLLILFTTGVTYGLPFSHSECQHEGKTYREGQEIRLSDPCVKCSCNRGSMVCRLRVCAAQPLPPPRGCWLLTRKDECCQKLICAEETDMGSARGGADVRLTDVDVKDGCLVNGTVYAEGSAMDSSTHCQYCYCIKGHQHCVTPHCLLTEPGCTPNYNMQDCCPTKYNCSEATVDSSTTTTSLPSTGCTIDGRFYPEGEMVTSSTSNCEKCYCMKGQIRCEPVICSLPVNAGCTAILTPGHCCPTSYNCNPSEGNEQSDTVPVNLKEETWRLEISNNEKFSHQNVYSERSMTDTLIFNSENKSTMAMTEPTKTLPNSTKTANTTQTTTTTQPMTTTIIIYTTNTDMRNPTTFTDIEITTDFETTTDLTTTESHTSTITTTEVPTTTDETTITTMSNSIFNDTEERMVSRFDDDLTSTLKAEDDTEGSTQTETTIIPTTIDGMEMEHKGDIEKKTNNVSDPIKSIPSELETILNNTHDKDEDYEYDYNEPSLPPSLPNLRIIPFVAADAVVDKPEDSGYTAAQEKSHPTDSPHFYEVLHSNRFSPPAETEGGFLPREPLLDGPFYESKYDAPYHTTGINGIAVDITSETILPSITEQPKIHEDERCTSGGQSYRHGELLTEPNACDLCLCFYGEILCQEPKCPSVKSGCHRLLEKEHGTCCGKIICSSNLESPTRVVDHVTPLPSGLQHAVPHLPKFTVDHDVVTPDPFRDVIRTEPAPDLPALIGEIMPYLWEHSTTTVLQPFQSMQPLTTPISITTQTISETTSTETSTTTTATSSTNPVTQSLELNRTAIPIDSITKAPNFTETTTNITDINKTSTWNSFSWEDEDTTKTPDYEDMDSQNEDDSFSFHSVFNYLFNNEPLSTSTTTLKPNLKIKKPVRVNATLLDIKVMNKTFSPNTVNIKNGSDEPLEHRSDDDVNLIQNFASSTERPSGSIAPGYGYPDDTKVVNISDFEKSTTKLTFSENKSTILDTVNVPHTTVKYFTTKTSTRKYFATKYSQFTTPRRPLLSKPTQQPNLPSLSVPDPGAASGLLKLAGCNIYGRMYRVGRIISELSGPCLECMCTEVGVQCRPLKC